MSAIVEWSPEGVAEHKAGHPHVNKTQASYVNGWKHLANLDMTSDSLCNDPRLHQIDGRLVPIRHGDVKPAGQGNCLVPSPGWTMDLT